MRVLVLGASGMLGHKLLQVLADSNDCWGTIRRSSQLLLSAAGYDEERLIATSGLPVGPALDAALDRAQPDVVVNCIGIVKQLDEAAQPIRAIEVNSLFPHQVAQKCSRTNTRFIHISTDCVFSGAKGDYSETDPPDAHDLYGRSKLLGEVTQSGHLTLRTSIVGRELAGQHGLLEWFLRQQGGQVKGFASAFFSGLTTLSVARVLDELIANHHSLSGLFHVASVRIDKYNLLEKINTTFDTRATIVPDHSLVLDRSLNGKRFIEATGIETPGWDVMLDEMARDAYTFGYNEVRARLVGGTP